MNKNFEPHSPSSSLQTSAIAAITFGLRLELEKLESQSEYPELIDIP